MTGTPGTTADSKAKPNRWAHVLYIEKTVSVIETCLNYLGMAVLIGLALMVVVQVTARYVFKSPILGYIDLMELMMASLVFLTIPYCQREGGHIRVELFLNRVFKGKRSYYLFETFLLILSLAGFGLIAYFSVKSTLNAYSVGDSTLAAYLPTWPTRMFVAIGSIFLCIRFIIQIIQNTTLAIFGSKGSPP